MVTPRLSERCRGRSRAARERSVGGAYSASEIRASAPTACCESFRARVWAVMARRRTTGSCSPTGRSTTMPATLLPSSMRSDSSRTETGTNVFSDRPSTRSLRASRKWRMPPATTVSTTSLTVPPSAPLMALTWSRSTRTTSKRRWGPTGTFSGVLGAGEATETANRPALAMVVPTRRGPRRAARTERTISAGWVARSTRESTSSCEDEGGGAGSHSVGSTGGGWGSRSRMTVATSTPEMPSTRAWWVFWMIATRSPSRPSTNHSSHRGRRRSRGVACRRPIRVLSCSSLPGLGRAVRRTW